MKSRIILEMIIWGTLALAMLIIIMKKLHDNYQLRKIVKILHKLK